MRFSLAEKGTKMAELKRCPFCGGKAKTRKLSSSGLLKCISVCYVECAVCKIHTSVELETDIAEEAWNRRYTPSEIDFDYEAED
jgi:Lar family restriction alleviation protein